MAARVGRAPPTRRQQLAPKRLRDAHGDGGSYRKEVTTEVALTSIIVRVVHVMMVMVMVIKVTGIIIIFIVDILLVSNDNVNAREIGRAHV